MIGTTGAIAAAVNAGFIAFAVGLTNSAIYGKFDFKTFLRSVLIAAITAGALDYLGNITINTETGPVKLNSLGLGGPSGKEVVAWDQRIVKYLVQATVSTGIQGLVNGSTRGLEQAFLASLVNQAGADLATQIGLTWKGEDQRFMNALAHATLGCAMAAAKRQECLDGAVGAVIAVVGNPYFDQLVGFDDTKLKLLSGGVAALVVQAMGGNAQTGLDAALNETLNNYLTQAQARRYQAEYERCGEDISCKGSIAIKYGLIDKAQDAGLAGGALAGVAAKLGVTLADLAELNAMLKDPIKMAQFMQGMSEFLSQPNLKERVGDQVFGSLQQKYNDFQEAYERGGTGSAQAGFILGELMFDAAMVAGGPGGLARAGAAGARGLTGWVRASSEVGAARIASLAPEVALNIGKPFEPLGLAVDPMSFADGVKLVRVLESRGLSFDEAVLTARELISTGSTLPVATPLDSIDTLYKLVPRGGSVFSGSPYWITADELALLKQNPALVSDRLALPASSIASEYEIYAIKPQIGAVGFQSVVAPTRQGTLSHNGGATQILIPNRNLFTVPGKVPETVKVPVGGK